MLHKKKPTIRKKEIDSLKAFSCLFPVLVHIQIPQLLKQQIYGSVVSKTCWINTPPWVLRARQGDETDHSPLPGAQV
jgi:hypothetical protein